MPDTPIRVGPLALQTTTPAPTVYTVPTPDEIGSLVAVLRHIRFANSHDAAIACFLAIGVDGVGTRLIAGELVPAAGSIDIGCFIPMQPGETLTARAATADKVALTISGVQVT